MADKRNPEKHLSRGMERRLREVQRADDILGKITPELLADLQRRREATAQADGFKSGNYGAGSVSTSTESAALSGLPDVEYDELGEPLPDDWRKHVRADFVGQSIESALAQLDIATKALREVDRHLNPVLNAASQYRERRSSIGQCQACGRDVPGTERDRLRSGYCGYVNDPTVDWSGCYDRWIRWRGGRPDRLWFENWVGEQLRAVASSGSSGAGYGVDEIDSLVANGTLPAASVTGPGPAVGPVMVMLEPGDVIYPVRMIGAQVDGH